MDFVERMSGLFGPRFSGTRGTPAKLMDFSNLSPRVQSHLQQVYLTLAVALAISTLGVCFSALTGFGQGLGILGFMISVPWMLATPARPDTLTKRRSLFGAAALSQGLLLAPLVRTALAVHPGVLVTAFGGTAAVFACFSAAALLSPRRQYLYLGGLLSSILSTFFLMRMATWVFGGSALLFQAELYIGLVVFAGYVVYDTQVIVERCEAGVPDTLRDALDLFVDFAAIFVRLLVILLRNAEAKQQAEREREGKGRGQQARRRDARTTRL